jgi:hypothetical protein
MVHGRPLGPQPSPQRDSRHRPDTTTWVSSTSTTRSDSPPFSLSSSRSIFSLLVRQYPLSLLPLLIFIHVRTTWLARRLRRSVQCRPLPGRVKSILVGVDRYQSLHRIQRSRGRMVRTRQRLSHRCHTILFCSLQGNLCDRLVHPRWWCSGSSYTDQESHQVCIGPLEPLFVARRYTPD